MGKILQIIIPMSIIKPSTHVQVFRMFIYGLCSGILDILQVNVLQNAWLTNKKLLVLFICQKLSERLTQICNEKSNLSTSNWEKTMVEKLPIVDENATHLAAQTEWRINLTLIG